MKERCLYTILWLAGGWVVSCKARGGIGKDVGRVYSGIPAPAAGRSTPSDCACAGTRARPHICRNPQESRQFPPISGYWRAGGHTLTQMSLHWHVALLIKCAESRGLWPCIFHACNQSLMWINHPNTLQENRECARTPHTVPLVPAWVYHWFWIHL